MPADSAGWRGWEDGNRTLSRQAEHQQVGGYGKGSSRWQAEHPSLPEQLKAKSTHQLQKGVPLHALYLLRLALKNKKNDHRLSDINIRACFACA
jgi:hypothetical protein